MCGIAGIYAYHPEAAPADRAELRRIRDRMVSRGPDGQGEWFSTDGRLALGHRRLAIIDPRPEGAQPMVSANGRYAIVFNGEIYNYRELRAELHANGSRFQSRTDTEVLLHLYACEQAAMLPRLRGMYAFAILQIGRLRGIQPRSP